MERDLTGRTCVGIRFQGELGDVEKSLDVERDGESLTGGSSTLELAYCNVLKVQGMVAEGHKSRPICYAAKPTYKGYFA